MSVIAFKETKDKIVVASDGIQLSGDIITKNDSEKIIKIEENLIIGSIGYSVIGDVFRNYFNNPEIVKCFASIKNTIDLYLNIQKFREFELKQYGFPEEILLETEFFIANKWFHSGIAFQTVENKLFPYSHSTEEHGSLGTPRVYVDALLDIGMQVDEAIKFASKKYNTINDNICLLEIAK